MIGFVKRLWAAAPFATLLLALALAAALLFGLRAGMLWTHRIDREHPIAAWMTPGLIAHSWHVPREVILDALDVPQPLPKRPMNLTELAEMNGTTVEALIAEAETAIADWRAAHPETGGTERPAPGNSRSEQPAPPASSPPGSAPPGSAPPAPPPDPAEGGAE